MARVKVHYLCLRPLSECECPDDGEPAEPQERTEDEGRFSADAAALEREGVTPGQLDQIVSESA